MQEQQEQRTLSGEESLMLDGLRARKSGAIARDPAEAEKGMQYAHGAPTKQSQGMQYAHSGPVNTKEQESIVGVPSMLQRPPEGQETVPEGQTQVSEDIQGPINFDVINIDGIVPAKRSDFITPIQKKVKKKPDELAAIKRDTRKAYNLQKTGAAGEAIVQAAGKEVEARQTEELAGAYDDASEKAKSNEEARAKAVTDIQKQIEEIEYGVESKKIDTGRWWNDKSAGSKVRVRLAGFFAGLGHVDGFGKWLDNQIAMDVDAQKVEFAEKGDRAKSLYATMAKLTGKEGAQLASEMLKIKGIQADIKAKAKRTESKAVYEKSRQIIGDLDAKYQEKRSRLQKQGEDQKEKLYQRDKISDTAKTRFGKLMVAQDSLAIMKQSLKNGDWVIMASSPWANDFSRALEAYTLNLGFYLSGANTGDNEIKLIRTALPKFKQSPENNRRGLKFVDLMMKTYMATEKAKTMSDITRLQKKRAGYMKAFSASRKPNSVKKKQRTFKKKK